MKVKYTKELMEEAIKDSYSIAEVCKKIGLKPYGSNYKTIKSKIELYNLDISHFTGQGWNKGKRLTNDVSIHSLEDIMKEGIIYSSSLLKARLIKEGLKAEKCERCECKDPSMLELHHKNRNHFDNRFENLEILCANCHRKEHRENDYLYPRVENKGERIKKEKSHLTICEYCGKEFYSPRLDKIQRFCCREHYEAYMKEYNGKTSITKEKLIELCEKYNNISQIAEELNVTRPTIRKYLIEYDLYDNFKMKYDFHSKIVEQYDLNLNFIKEWPSVSDAENSLNIAHGDISKCALHKRRSAGGFIWKYKE